MFVCISIEKGRREKERIVYDVCEYVEFCVQACVCACASGLARLSCEMEKEREEVWMG